MSPLANRTRHGKPDNPRVPPLVLALLVLLVAPLAGALPGDREQAIRISADSALRDEKEGFTVYTGNVELQQGSLRINADKVTVHHRVDAAERIVAEGNPAHLQEQPEPDKGLLHARARVIEYFNSEERVQLRRQASIEQDGSLVTGDSIDYFIAEQRVRANSDASAEDGRRVEVVIPARVVNQGSGDGTPAPGAASETDSKQESRDGAADRK
ncbi:MAG: lipopolysaccharide transport periplasmic protein LptA [Haliea sp.]|nr:lipopolysaccharide transport periplasmic protein LptA [Haliea sp.]|tara:strand:- start:214 stop:852 length:639 start_codon:yes stop_codon:yes gene_type:complete